MRYTKQEIIRLVEDKIIQEDPRLADPEYRKRLPEQEKRILVARMVMMGKRLELFPY